MCCIPFSHADGERLSPRHPFRLWDACTTGSRVQRAANHLISCVCDMCPAAHHKIRVRAQDMCKQSHVLYALSPEPTRPGCSASLRPCIRSRSRTHCCCQMPDLRYLPEAQTKAPACDASGGGRPALQGRLKRPAPERAPEATPRTIPCPVGLHFSALYLIAGLVYSSTCNQNWSQLLVTLELPNVKSESQR
jgi:hypothetical protein